MHCNLRRSQPRQSLSALISSPMPSLKSHSLTVDRRHLTADRLFPAVNSAADCLIALTFGTEFDYGRPTAGYTTNVQGQKLTVKLTGSKVGFTTGNNVASSKSQNEQSTAELLRFEHLTL